MPATEMTVMVAITAAIILGFIFLLRLIATVVTHGTIRKVVESNPNHAEALLEKLAKPRERSGDDRLAFVLIAIGIAMAAAAIIASDDPGDIRAAIGASLFPLLVGGALWLRFRAVERAKRRDGTE